MPTVTLKYFAWIREKAGIAEEQVTLPPDVITVVDLLRWQAARGHPFDHAFEHEAAIRVAVNHVHVTSSTPLGEAREIAFFPPVTGG